MRKMRRMQTSAMLLSLVLAVTSVSTPVSMIGAADYLLEKESSNEVTVDDYEYTIHSGVINDLMTNIPTVDKEITYDESLVGDSIVENEKIEDDILEPVKDEEDIEETVENEDIVEEQPIIESEEEVIVEEVKPLATDEEIELLALVMLAEARGECEEGKRLVIDVILNRVDSPSCPNTITEVIYQPGQFESMTNGQSDLCTVTEADRQLVREELESRYNSEVLFFRTNHYHTFGTPLFQVGNHYFSK